LDPSAQFGADAEGSFQILWEDGDRVFLRGWFRGPDGNRNTVLAVLPAAERPTPASLDRLAHEYALRDELDAAWAVRPLALVRDGDRPMLVLEDPGGEPLERLLGAAMEMERFLRLGIGIGIALGKAHQRGLVHKDIKPGNILVNRTTGEVKLTGFGIASRLPRERQAPEPPESIAGTLAYMAPEQTGRMNRSTDTRSDLYSLGVTLYQMLTGTLPFTAVNPMEWVHCHIARKPVPPAERLANVPAPVSGIIMKLLAKAAEDRYQTAAGVERDLRRCLAAWEARRQIDDFPVAEDDAPGKPFIPEKLYGREHEIEILLAAFDRVVKGGAPKLVLVSGYSGIGKSSVVNELHRIMVPPRGLFASGKFDQHKRDIPYSTLVQAFESLVRSLLSKGETELARWRDAFQTALSPNGRLIVDLVPELRLIIGEQPAVPELAPQDAQRRFQMALERFIGVFARPEHPLVLFLDDLQWLDAATLDFLEDLSIRSDLQHLMLIGAYRDNEVTTTHPLMRKLDVIKAASGTVVDITLAPLAREHLAQLIADALRCAPERAASLVQLVHEKTGGNPFFAIQFLSSLVEEGMLTFDHEAARWSWDLARIHAKRYTDNVVDLMVAKLGRLPAETQKALQLLACFGSAAEIRALSIVQETSEAQVEAAFWDAVRQQLVERSGGFYKFTHDRVEEAAYSLIPEAVRATTHLRIGRLLATQTPSEKRAGTTFEIVNQLNRGAVLISSPDEREKLAELNLRAGKRAKASTAYASALTYLAAGAALLEEDSWEGQHELVFELELHRAECEFLTGALPEAEQRLVALSAHAATTVERTGVTCLLADLYTALDQGSRAIAIGLDYLRHLGIDWSPHPTEHEVRREYARIWSRLGSRAIEELIDLPLMSDAASLAALDVLTKLGPSAHNTDANLRSLMACRAVNLSLEGGNCDGSCYAYTVLGQLAGPHFGDYQVGLRLGRLGYELVERLGLKRFQARTHMNYALLVMLWTRDIRGGRDLMRRALETAIQIGDVTYAAICYTLLNTNRLALGDPLDEVQREAEHGLAFAKNMRFGFVIDFISGQLGLTRTLRGLTPDFGCFDDALFDELQLERHFSSNSDLAVAEGWYWIRKLQARVFAGDHASACEAASKAQRLLWAMPSMFETVEYHYYAALSRAASCGSADAGHRQQDVEALVAHHQQLEVWAAVCRENFENRAALVGAEIARIEGRALDAMDLYEQAVCSARTNGFVHNEALANELAARFYAARGFEKIAYAYLRDARYCYLRWGAHGKLRQLDDQYPHLEEKEPAHGAITTMGTPVEHLDLATVLRVSQAVSSEMVLETLIDTLMRTAIEHAGAVRGLLILPLAGEQRVAAEATTDGDAILVHLRDTPVTTAVMPDEVLNYVLRTQENVILHDAVAGRGGPLTADPYIRQHQARSILCLPLINQVKLTGVLYLENNLAANVFSPTRVAVLKLLASQAAISLENSRLYRDLAKREAKIRRLVDANIIGINIWDSNGRIIEANEAFLHMVGYSQEDLASGRMRWTDLTTPEWRELIPREIAELKMKGSLQAFEKEYLRKDGSRVPVLIGSALFDEQQGQGLAFVLDLTDRKRAEAEAREIEGRYREIEMELAHANRLATMGQLTASIAHEVNQPIAATVTNAQAALRWLARQPPDLEEVRQALDRIVETGRRTGDVIDRVRALIKKTPPRKYHLDINDAVREVIELTRGEAIRSGVSVQMRLADELPFIEGDRVQLQQVILNLIINAIEAVRGSGGGSRELLINTRKTEHGGVLLAVRDSGPGFDPAALDRLFDTFYTTKPDGLGLGLSICRSIIEAHGGRIWADANVPHGAVFQFTVPAHPGGTA
jgi:PAS domain S-box-containing protein